MAQIFLSYAHEDTLTAAALAQALVESGWTVFWDREISLGASYSKAINEELEQAQCAIVLWSHASIASRHVFGEAETAAERQKLIPALIERCEVDSNFKQINTLDLIGWDGQASHSAFKKLQQELTARLGLLGGKRTLESTVHDVMRRRRWYELPKLLAAVKLMEIRNELRQQNLHDTEDPPLDVVDLPLAPNAPPRTERTVDGTFNDLRCPAMGAAGRRFGRNVPLRHTFQDTARLFTPHPQLVSRALMTRDVFKPATGLNVLAAAWAHFMIHGSFAHQLSSEAVAFPSLDSPNHDEPMRVRKSMIAPVRDGSPKPPAYLNVASHWVDGAALYGRDAVTVRSRREGRGGRLALNNRAVSTSVWFRENWWVGPAAIATLLTLEHNFVCESLGEQHPDWNDDQLYGKAHLIMAALMHRINYIEWTGAMFPSPVVETALNTNWRGIAEGDTRDTFGLLADREVLDGIAGGPTDHHGVPFALTEEFASVSRLHPMLPDHLLFRSPADGRAIAEATFPEMVGDPKDILGGQLSLADVLYTLGTEFPGALTLHNYPRYLQQLPAADGPSIDLAALDIFRDRERGVPRYNQFRRLLRLEPITSFGAVTEISGAADAIQDVYAGDLEAIDLLTGIYAEPKLPGCAYGETAFRVHMLMTVRRLKSDRFLTADFREEIYTPWGIEHVNRSSLKEVLRRHVPEVEIAGMDNAFRPWRHRA